MYKTYGHFLSTLSFLLLSSLLCTNLFAQGTDEVEEKSVTVILGIDKIEKLDFDPSTKVQIGSDAILSYQIIPQKREITFKGIKAGETSLILRNTVGDIKARYIVRVIATNQSKIVQELRAFLGDIEGLEIGIKGDEIVYIGGKIVVPADIGKIVIMLEKYPEVVSLVELAPATQQIIARKMQEEINKESKNVTVRVVNGLYWLEGTVVSAEEKARVNKIAAAYLPDSIDNLARRTDSVKQVRRDVIQDFITINEVQEKQTQPIPPMIKITAQFVELSKDYTKVFGFKWVPLLSEGSGAIAIGKTSGNGVTAQSSGSLSATISNLFPKLQSARSAAHARVVQSGVIIVQDGVAGSLQKESNIPFSVGSGEFMKAESAKAGFNLSVTPTVREEEKIELQLGIGVSDVSGNPPTTLTNQISTRLTIKSKETAAIGGIVVNKEGTSYDKDQPGGTTQTEDENASTLFSFVKYKKHTAAKNQFVVFITPELVESAAAGTEEIKTKFKRRGL